MKKFGDLTIKELVEFTISQPVNNSTLIDALNLYKNYYDNQFNLTPENFKNILSKDKILDDLIALICKNEDDLNLNSLYIKSSLFTSFIQCLKNNYKNIGKNIYFAYNLYYEEIYNDICDNTHIEVFIFGKCILKDIEIRKLKHLYPNARILQFNLFPGM